MGFLTKHDGGPNRSTSSELPSKNRAHKKPPTTVNKDCAAVGAAEALVRSSLRFHRQGCSAWAAVLTSTAA